MTKTTIGIDISKAALDVHRLSDGATGQFVNDASGFCALARWLNRTPVARVVYEPTGPYHGTFETALGTRFPLVKVNPLQARRFAQAHGTRAKTDRVDARMLAIMGQAFALEPQSGVPEKQRALRELQVARQALLRERTRTLNREKTLTLAILKRQSTARLRLLKRQLAEVDAEIQSRLEQHHDTARARDILCSIPGL